jgi:hypothetical protein
MKKKIGGDESVENKYHSNPHIFYSNNISTKRVNPKNNNVDDEPE